MNIEEKIASYTTTDLIKLNSNQQEELTGVLSDVLDKNSHIKQLIKVNLLKNTPSYDLTACYSIDSPIPESEVSTCYIETRLILKKHVIECLKRGDEFDREKPIGYLDNQYAYKGKGYLPTIMRTPSEVFLDKEDRIHFNAYGVDKDDTESQAREMENVSMSMHLMLSILFAILNPKEVEKVIDVAPKLSIVKENKARKKTSKRPIKVQRVLTINPSGYKRFIRTKGREFTRFTNVWGVIGHIRHYKNGKKVYIKPYEKGKDRNKGLLKPRERIIDSVDVKNLELLTEGL